MGKGKDHANKKAGGGKQFAESSDQIESRNVKKLSKARDMPPSSNSEEEDDEEIIPVKAGKQNANAGMMPPSDDSEEEESEEEEDTGPVATPAEMAVFIKSRGLEGELKAWLKAKSAKSGKVCQLC